MEKETHESEREENQAYNSAHKDRSLIYMGLILAFIILVMGYLTFFVDDPLAVFEKKEATPVKVVEDGSKRSILDESDRMNDEEVRSSLVKFIEAFYYDQSRGYFDPPSYFATITETFYNYHNLTHSRLKDIYWKRRKDMESLRRTWLVSTLKFDREGPKIVATYWTKESFFRPSLNQQYSANIQYEMIIDENGKIVSLRDINRSDEAVQTINIDSAIGSGGVPPGAPTEVSIENKVYDASVLDIQPEFPGGQKEFAKYISQNLKYPVVARQNNVSGKVYVAFIVERDGSVNDVKIRQGIGGGCDEEALRLIKNSPNWKPGMLKGSPVRTYIIQPISFQLTQ